MITALATANAARTPTRSSIWFFAIATLPMFNAFDAEGPRVGKQG